MKIMNLVVGPIDVNCYLVWDEATNEGIVLDPGGDGSDIVAEIKANDIKVRYVVNTHGHSDHIGANDDVLAATGAKLLIHKDDAVMLTDARANLSLFMGLQILSRPADGYLAEGDVVEFGSIKLKVLHTPGHSAGGICLVGGGAAFVGDTLFAGSIGRTDFPGGSEAVLVGNIKKKLLTLPDDTQVFTGHGPATTIGQEKKYNPYLG